MDYRHNFPPPRHVKELFSLEGKVALVTGGAGLYGSGISSALAEAGAKVIIASRNREKCEAKAEELRSRGGDALGAELDLSCEQSIADLADWIEREFGRLDVLFNNAVARCAPKDFSAMTAQDWNEPMAVNSTGLFLSSRYFGELIAKQGKGSIVNIGSIYGLVGPHFWIYEGTDMKNPAQYAFAKGGLVQFTRYLATYYAPRGVRVNSISPGGYFTGQPEPFVEDYCLLTPLGRMAAEEDIKGVAVFLASDASAYITGVDIPLDGGWTAW